jgi:hypothetical protein
MFRKFTFITNNASFEIRELNDIYVEEQAFSLPYDLAPLPSPPPISKLSLFLSLPVLFRWFDLTDGRGGRGRGGAKSYDDEKAWSSINNSLPLC